MSANRTDEAYSLALPSTSGQGYFFSGPVSGLFFRKQPQNRNPVTKRGCCLKYPFKPPGQNVFPPPAASGQTKITTTLLLY
ncbi:hypothetical protein FHS90_004420 [Rufibacter quisquiliarum]|uniref:Uncharacterized protein n=1 Tax=Rufibacter quisquiliarum TaxID=1549639 RepID=A0A839GLU1_9BACT|nr:hypothetical protein [Rufibacter quisquiliarum]